MGERPTYRWERRRIRTASQNRSQKRELYFHQLIALTLIFCLLAIGTRILVIVPIAQLHCIEAVATYGETEKTIPIYQALQLISLIALAWLTIVTLKYLKWFQNWIEISFQASLILSLILAAFIFRAFSIDNVVKPDGYLGTDIQVASQLPDGSIVYNPLVSPWPEYDHLTKWHLGEPEPYAFQSAYNVQKGCVWEETKTITISDLYPKQIDGYHAASREEKIDLLEYSYFVKEWPEMSFSDMVMRWRDYFFDAETWAEKLRDNQQYRRMTPEEWERYETKKACLLAAKRSFESNIDCDYRIATDWDF